MIFVISLMAMLWTADANAAELGGPQLQIVAHEDDDLLFMNPTVQHAMDAGRWVVSVYLTAGDAGMRGPYWHAREAGIRAAYAAMAHEPDAWEKATLKAGPAVFDLYTLAVPARIMVLFLHLPDGGEGLGTIRYHDESLRELWQGSIKHIDTVDGRQTLTKNEVVDALESVLQLFRPANVELLDCTGQHGWDHNDHYYSAMFGLAAYNRYTASTESHLTLHRAYNIKDLPANMTPADTQAKRRVVNAYIPFDQVLCPPDRPCVVNGLYALWLEREYLLQGTFLEDDLGCMGGAP